MIIASPSSKQQIPANLSSPKTEASEAPKEKFTRSDAYNIEGKVLKIGAAAAVGAFAGLGHGFAAEGAAIGIGLIAGGKHGFNYGYHTAKYCELREPKGLALGGLGAIAGGVGAHILKAHVPPVAAAIVLGAAGATLAFLGGKED